MTEEYFVRMTRNASSRDWLANNDFEGEIVRGFSEKLMMV